MENIDWDKAPEGATHCHAPNEFFYRYVGDALMVFRDGKWGESHLMDHSRINLIQRPSPSLSGEGLPPVGVVCEVEYDTGRELWHEAEVIYHKSDDPRFAAVRLRGSYHDKLVWCSQFRPIRTPEQIAADEREAAIEQIMSAYEYKEGTCTHKLMRDQAARFYDAGLYRKP